MTSTYATCVMYAATTTWNENTAGCDLQWRGCKILSYYGNKPLGICLIVYVVLKLLSYDSTTHHNVQGRLDRISLTGNPNR